MNISKDLFKSVGKKMTDATGNWSKIIKGLPTDDSKEDITKKTTVDSSVTEDKYNDDGTEITKTTTTVKKE